MARFICRKVEVNPYEENAVARFVYFKGTPTQAQLKKHLTEADDIPEKHQDVVSKMAGLERWCVGTSF